MTWLLVAWLAAGTADAVTTAYALRHGRQERWLPGSPAAVEAQIIAATVGGAVALHYAHRTHPKWTFAIGAAGTGFKATVAWRQR